LTVIKVMLSEINYSFEGKSLETNHPFNFYLLSVTFQYYSQGDYISLCTMVVMKEHFNYICALYEKMTCRSRTSIQNEFPKPP